jgi:hypothetical protein
MKKTLFVSALLFAWAVLSPGAQEGVTDTGAGRDFMSDVSLLNAGDLGSYSKLFLNGNGSSMSSKYLRTAPREDLLRVSALEGDNTSVDTPLEIALLSTCAGVVDIRPVMPPEVEAILPKNDPRLSDLKLGAAVYMDMQAAKFLGSDPAPHAVALKFITDRGRVTEADIKKFMEQGIAAAVDAEFNKVSFLLENSRTNPVRSHNAVLTRNQQNGQYMLSYEGAYTTNGHQEITEPTLDALLAEMGRRKTDFDQIGINQVREKAALIPAVVIAEAGTTDAILGTTKNILTNFYLNPTTATYNNITALDVTYQRNYERFVSDKFFELTRDAFTNTLYALNLTLAQRVHDDRW